MPRLVLTALALLALALPSVRAASPTIQAGTRPTAEVVGSADLAEGDWWIRVGGHLFSPAFDPSLPRSPEDYRLVPGLNPAPWTEPHRVFQSAGWTLLAFPDGAPNPWPADQSALPPGYIAPEAARDALPPPADADGSCRFGPGAPVLVPHPGMEIAAPLAGPRRRSSESGLPSDAVQALVDQITAQAYRDRVESLTLLGQRNTFTAGAVAARDLIAEAFEGFGLETTTPSFTFSTWSGTHTAWNVVGVLEGTTRPDEFVLVGGHYDSLPNPPALSPGAEDNASGTAATMEAARVLSQMEHQRTLVFVAFGAEEQGLIGSSRFVQALTAAERENLIAAITLDMVGFTADAQLDVLIETLPFATPLLDELAAAADEFTDLEVFTSFAPFGSDHMPFLNNGLPAVLLITNDWDRYPHYHRSTDTIDQITPAQGAAITRMALATAARLANPDPLGPGSSWILLAD